MAARPTIEPGNKGKSVLAMKRLLKKHLVGMKYYALNKKVPLNMVYDANAVKGIKILQRKYGLEQDGIVGPKTWEVLNKAATKPKPAKPLTIYSRETWKAKPPKARQKCDWDVYTTSRLHHTVTPAPKPGLTPKALIAAERAAMRQLQDIAFARGFSDISYSYIVFPSGHVYEGRGFEVLGAHTIGHNADVGIALVGNYENDKVTPAQEAAVKKLRRKIAVNRGSLVAHCKTYSTSCPGKNARETFGLSC